MPLDVTKGAPDGADAARRLERLTNACAHIGIDLSTCSESAQAVIRLCCQRAPYLATLLIRDPHRLLRVTADPYLRREKPGDVMVAELAALRQGDDSAPGEEDDDALYARLRRYRADEMVRLGVRELQLSNRHEVGRELAHLADACFDAAITHYDRVLRTRFGAPRYSDDDGVERNAELVVIGMGKLGGEELNFVSDVDVIYIYSSDSGSAGDISLREYFSKLCKLVSAAIGQVTEDDWVFRVDLRLRPEGSQGALANALLSAERYYMTASRPWERQAWLKARPCAGSRELGQTVMNTLSPFIYPRSTPPLVVSEVVSLNRRIKAELNIASVSGGFDLKNGIGGIREIEFYVQALQLLYAGQSVVLRSRATLGALNQLLFAGHITENDFRALSAAYRYLRHAEHLLQLDSGRQTQRLPSKRDQLALFARRLGHDGVDDFLEVLGQHTREVARLFATLGESDEEPPPEALALVAGDRERAEELHLLSSLGCCDPEHAHHELTIARKKSLSPFSLTAHEVPARIAPALMREIAASPDPDQALHYISGLTSRTHALSVWHLFDASPSTMRLVVSLFGTSSFLARTFVTHPELIDILVDIGRSQPTRTMAQLETELDAQLSDVELSDEGERWNRLAEFKNAQVLRIGLADIGGELDSYAVAGELSRLAEVCLARAYSFVHDSLMARHGVPRDAKTGAPVTMAIVALGKLGSGELSYASDLDLVFVYSADGESDGRVALDNVTYLTRLAQRLMSGVHAMHPGGRLYEIDTRLRPSGSQGLLVSSLSAWQHYHRGQAQLWERQALIKLRPVAGDPTLGDQVAQAAAQYVYGYAPGESGREDATAIAKGVTSMRDKIERELVHSSRDYNLKAGRGGLIDIEFAAQYLQLLHGHRYPQLRTRETVVSLERAAELGLADAQDCTLLIDGHRFLLTLENRMRIVNDRSVHTMPRDQLELNKLARRTGYPDGSALRADYERWARDIRAAYERIVGS